MEGGSVKVAKGGHGEQLSTLTSADAPGKCFSCLRVHFVNCLNTLSDAQTTRHTYRFDFDLTDCTHVLQTPTHEPSAPPCSAPPPHHSCVPTGARVTCWTPWVANGLARCPV